MQVVVVGTGEQSEVHLVVFAIVVQQACWLELAIWIALAVAFLQAADACLYTHRQVVGKVACRKAAILEGGAGDGVLALRLLTRNPAPDSITTLVGQYPQARHAIDRGTGKQRVVARRRNAQRRVLR
ncbi:hypothetical protein D3C76_892280 [compost metagenome]